MKTNLLQRACLAAALVVPASAQDFDVFPNPDARPEVFESASGVIYARDGQNVLQFSSWTEYAQSSYFLSKGKRCGTDRVMPQVYSTGTAPVALQADCTSTFTNPSAAYAPSVAAYRIPVVVHVLMNTSGQGAISDPLIQSQIDILNEDFKALTGTPGAPGTNTAIEFYLAGVTRTTNNNWFNDTGTYYSTLAWDTNNYLNIYTNTAGGNLGYAYVPNGGGVVGNTFDRVVILWNAFGRNAPIGAPYNQGRTATHEVGHYLGLYHTFQGGCSALTGCNANGDLICDTLPESVPNYACAQVTCGDPDPVTNYMDYSEDLCMTNFTPEQARRMRCTLESWRVQLAEPAGGVLPPSPVSSPTPANAATNVATTATLAWAAAANSTSYNVYFGVDSTPDSTEFLGNQVATTFNPGALTGGTTYYWRIDSVGAGGTTAGPVWSFSTALPSGVTVTLFSDGFESNSFTTGGWTRQNTNSTLSTAADYTPNYGARIARSSWIQKTLSTVGYNTIRVKYARRTAGLDAAENLYVEWSANGTTWTAIETTKATAWSIPTFTLPVGANGLASLRVRFRTNANSTTEWADLDDVVITGVRN